MARIVKAKGDVLLAKARLFDRLKERDGLKTNEEFKVAKMLTSVFGTALVEATDPRFEMLEHAADNAYVRLNDLNATLRQMNKRIHEDFPEL